MARIRTIKPEFWTDEKLSECSVSARLLFIGLISFSDDAGRMEYNPARVRMQVFPCGTVSTKKLTEWIGELSERSLIRIYAVDGKQFLDVPGFQKHQKINRPTPSRLPPFPAQITESSVSPPENSGPLMDGMEGNGTGKGMEEESPPTPPSGGGAPDLEQQIQDAYHEILPELPRVKEWTTSRSSKLRARIRERLAEGKPADTVDYWRKLFEKVAKSDLLTGRKKDWRANLEWLIEKSNFTKLIEGNYDNVERHAA